MVFKLLNIDDSPRKAAPLQRGDLNIQAAIERVPACNAAALLERHAFAIMSEVDRDRSRQPNITGTTVGTRQRPLLTPTDTYLVRLPAVLWSGGGVRPISGHPNGENRPKSDIEGAGDMSAQLRHSLPAVKLMVA